MLRGDRNIRDYFNTPKLVSTALGEEPMSLTEILNYGSTFTKYSFFSYQTAKVDGLTQNILNEYMAFLTDKEEYFTLVTLDKYAAILFQYKSRSLAKYLYGDTSMYWIITFFNEDIQHDSDLTANYLRNNGLVVLNSKGLEALDKLVTFKEKLETQVDGGLALYNTEM